MGERGRARGPFDTGVRRASIAADTSRSTENSNAGGPHDLCRIVRGHAYAAVNRIRFHRRSGDCPAARGQDHWVATWATALVARPLPPPGAPGQGGPPPNAGWRRSGSGAAAQARPGAPPANAGPRPGFPPPATVTNQTIRQIVHTSIGGDRVRVVLSNAFGTTPLEVGAAMSHCATRLGRRRRVGEAAHVWRERESVDPSGCDARERRGRPEASAAHGPRDRPLPAGGPRHRPLAGDDSQRRVANELPFGERRPHGRPGVQSRGESGRMVPPRTRRGRGARGAARS